MSLAFVLSVFVKAKPLSYTWISMTIEQDFRLPYVENYVSIILIDI